MPKYDYEDKDGNITEYEFPYGKAPKEYEGKTRIINGTVSVRFKGSGWTKLSTDPLVEPSIINTMTKE